MVVGKVERFLGHGVAWCSHVLGCSYIAGLPCRIWSCIPWWQEAAFASSTAEAGVYSLLVARVGSTPLTIDCHVHLNSFSYRTDETTYLEKF